ncbi:MAG: ATP-binding protein [Mariprofundaceae bacterium]
MDVPSKPPRRLRHRLLLIRGAMLAAFGLFLLWAQAALGATGDWRGFIAAALVWAACSLPLMRPGRIPGALHRVESHLAIDTAALGWLLYQHGGQANPLISLLLIPVLIAALTLPQRRAWIIGAAVIALYTLLTRHFVPLPGLSMMTGGHEGFHFHLLGMWLTFVITVVMLLTIVARMSEDRRRRELELAALRQQALRDRSMAALGAQAASDAHELGTPINTLLMLLDEWRADPHADPARLARMQTQLDHCRKVLARLGRRAASLQSPEPLPARRTVADALAQWRNLHPDAQATLEPDQADGMLAPDAPLEQAVFILLDNAREAGARHIRLSLAREGAMIELACADDGPGFPPAALPRIGVEPVPGKPGGKGLGLYLLGHLLAHAGGGLVAANGASGAIVRVRHPVLAEASR